MEENKICFIGIFAGIPGVARETKFVIIFVGIVI